MNCSSYEPDSSSRTLDSPFFQHIDIRLSVGKSDLLAEYVLAIQKLMTEKASGINPFVRIKIFSLLANESIPTLYRKQLLGTCPRPIKRGRSSLWKLSEIELYLGGNWTACTNQDDHR